MCDHAGAAFAAGADGHPQCVEHEIGLQVVAHRPADDPPAVDVLHGRQEEEALTGLHVLVVADPEPVRLRSGEAPVDQVGGGRPRRVPCRGAGPATAAVSPTQAELTHQTGYTFAPDPDAMLELQLGVDARGAVDPFRLDVDAADLLAELGIGDRPCARGPALPGVVARACDAKHAGEQGDVVACALLVDQAEATHR